MGAGDALSMTDKALHPPEAMARKMRIAALASISVAGILAVTKLVAFVLSDSISILGSLVDSALDMTASGINLLAIRVALVPPDEDHRFGHGKAEPIAGLFQAAIISGSAVFVMWESISRLIDPQPIREVGLGVGVSVLAIVLTAGLVAYQRHVVRVTDSVAIEADKLHYGGDLLLNLSVIAALLITHFTGFLRTDAIFGLGIAAFLGHAAYGILTRSIDMLMDKELKDEQRQKILDLAMGNEHVLGVHDLKTRRGGIHTFIQMHIEVPQDMSLKQAHYVADEVEATIGENFPDADIIIHTDPFGLEEPDHVEGEVR